MKRRSTLRDGPYMTYAKRVEGASPSNPSLAATESNLVMAGSQSELWLKLYEIYSADERYWLSEHHTRMVFYSGFLTSALGATIVGFFNAKEFWHFLLLTGAGAMIAIFGLIAMAGLGRLYQRFLESIVMRAKMEQHLGLHTLRPPEDAVYWKDESFIPGRFIAARATSSNSTEFIAAHANRGYQRVAKRLMWVFVGAGLSVAAINLALATGLVGPTAKRQGESEILRRAQGLGNTSGAFCRINPATAGGTSLRQLSSPSEISFLTCCPVGVFSVRSHNTSTA